MMLEGDAIARAIEMVRPKTSTTGSARAAVPGRGGFFQRGDPVDLATLGQRLKDLPTRSRGRHVLPDDAARRRRHRRQRRALRARVVREKAVLRAHQGRQRHRLARPVTPLPTSSRSPTTAST